MSAPFWMVIVVMAVVAFGFVASPLFRSNRRAMLLVVAIAVPILAAGLYMQLGSPGAGETAHSTRLPPTQATRDSASSGVASVASMVEGLANRLRDNPDDGGSWLLLARSHKHLNRTAEASAAYEKAAALGQYDAELAMLGSDTAEAPSFSAQIYGNVNLSANAPDIVRPDDTVVIFAKALHGPAAPLAVLQRSASELPIDFLLNDSQSMVAGLRLSDFEEVVVTARITRGGDATVALQGLQAHSSPIQVAENRHLNLTIK